MTARNPSGQILGWVGSKNHESLAGLKRKLPHYGKYSYLVFDGDAPAIQYKGEWAVTRSPLKIEMTGSDHVINELSPSALWPPKPR